MADFAAKVDGVESFPREKQEIEKGGGEDPGSGKDEGGEAGDQADGGCTESIDDGGDGQQTLDSVEYERVSLPPSVPIESGHEEKDGGEAKGVEDHHAVDLYGGGEAGRKFGADKRGEKCGVEEFQGIDAEENQAKQRGVEKNGPAIADAIAAEENVMREPNIDEHQEADGGSGKGRRGRAEVREASGNDERDDQEDESDAKHDVAKNVETGDDGAAEAKVLVELCMRRWHRTLKRA